jgi:hypothetical protein
LISEVSDLVAGAGILLFVLAPFAVPFLALVALVGIVLLIPVVLGAMLVAPVLVARRWWRSHARSSDVVSEVSRSGEVTLEQRESPASRVTTIGQGANVRTPGGEQRQAA